MISGRFRCVGCCFWILKGLHQDFADESQTLRNATKLAFVITKIQLLVQISSSFITLWADAAVMPLNRKKPRLGGSN
jgi:hypothetical protein